MAKNEKQSLSDPLFSFEYIVLLSSMQSHVSDWTQFLWCHWPSPLQRPEGRLLPWVSNLSRQTTNATIHASHDLQSRGNFFRRSAWHVSQEHIGQMTCTELQKTICFFRNPRLNLVAHLFVSKRTTLIIRNPLHKFTDYSLGSNPGILGRMSRLLLSAYEVTAATTNTKEHIVW